MTPEDEIKRLRQELAASSALIEGLRSMNKKSLQLDSASTNMAKMGFIGMACLDRTHEILRRWIDWCELDSEKYMKRYGISEDSMVTLLELTKKYMNHSRIETYSEISKEKDRILQRLRRAIARKQSGRKVALTLELDSLTQEEIVKAIDAIDRLKKDV